MNLERRVEKLEKAMTPKHETLIVRLTYYGDQKLPPEEEQIAQQRAEGKRFIVVSVPYGYVPKGGYTD